jgi:hypothetical protein
MSKKLPLTDFRAVRSVLEPHEFALSEGDDPAPSNLIDQDTWYGIIHLPDDVAIRTSDHNGTKLQLLYSLWGDWVQAIGDPDRQDELYNCMLDAADCFQCATFDLLHGYYRSALANLRAALELVMIGTYGNLYPTDFGYLEWKRSESERFGFSKCRRHLHKTLTGSVGSWIFEDNVFPIRTYTELCAFTHSRPNASDGALWESNGPIYSGAGVALSFRMSLRVYAICYLLVRIARPSFVLPADSGILFELDWLENHAETARAYKDIYR